MDFEDRFKQILAQYTPLGPEELTADMRFREDLSLSSLDFATMLGELEDEFDMDFEEDTGLAHVSTIADALAFLEADHE